MKKIALAMSFALASLLGASAFAQKDVPGEARAQQVAPATKAEKAEAKKARKVHGKEMSKKGEMAAGEGKPESAATGAKVAKEDRKAARSKRKSAGAEARKATKRDLN